MRPMKRWAGPALLVLLACALIVIWHPRSRKLLELDTDTEVLLSRLSTPHNPWKWFASDWPLQNRFYRPVSTLSYEIDLRTLGNRELAPSLFFTSACICALCVFAVFWLAAEMGLKPFAAAAAALLFANWNLLFYYDLESIGLIAGALLFLAGAARQRKSLGRFVPASLALVYFASELQGPFHREAPDGFYMAVLAWLPGRAAAMMCLFAVGSMAAYIRYEKLRSAEPVEQRLSTDLPATRMSVQATSSPAAALPFAILAVLLEALALGSYEQAVMLPIVLILVAACVRATGRKPDLRLHIGFWLVLAGYFIVRWAVLPSELSGYQFRALRTGPGTLISLAEYAFPTLADLPSWIGTFSLGIGLLLTSALYTWPLNFSGNLVAYGSCLPTRRIALMTWAASLAAFLPMAFLKPFAHYHYWPSAIRAVFVISLFGAISKLVVNAVSLPNLQAPPRPSPAPGSLRHR